MDKSIEVYIHIKANELKKEIDKLLEKELEITKNLVITEDTDSVFITPHKTEKACNYLSSEIRRALYFMLMVEVFKEKKEKLNENITFEEYLDKSLDILKKHLLIVLGQ